MLGKTLSVAALSFSVMTLLGCSNLVGDIVGSDTVVCNSTSDAGGGACVISKNIPSSEQSTVQSDCTNGGGALVSACPAAGLVGCCAQSEAEVTVESCYYSGTATELKSQCASGTWSATP